MDSSRCSDRARRFEAAIRGIALMAVVVALNGCASSPRPMIPPDDDHPRADKAAEKANEKAAKISVIDAVKAAQMKAIAAAKGGKPDVPITWTESKSGLKGTIVLDSSVTYPFYCPRFLQTMIVGNETLKGPLVACPEDSGVWKIVDTPPP